MGGRSSKGNSKTAVRRAPVGRERRACQQAMNRWRRLAGPGDVPNLSQMHPFDQDEDLRNAFLLRLDAHLERSVFLMMGPGIEPGDDQAESHKLLSEALPEPIAEQIYGAIRLAIQSHKPRSLDGRYEPSPGMEVLFRAAVMPVKGLNNAVDYLFGAFSASQPRPQCT